MSSQTALVTGGSSGIGLATARALLERGVAVVVADVAEPPSDLQARFVRCDVRSADDWRALVDEAGPFDLAFLNAGVASGQADFLRADLEDVERVLRIDVDGVLLGTHFVAPGMAARGGGAIVATASIAGLMDVPMDPVYSAAKHAVVGFVRSAAVQLEREGITINAVCPGLTDTPIIQDAGQFDELVAKLQLMAPEQIADAVLRCFDGDDSGAAWVCQPGRDPIRFGFRGVPGPARASS